MGNRRLGRKRLYTIEKQGQTVDLSPGLGMAPAIERTTQHRLGQELITEIVVDLGTSKATIIGGGAEEDACGVSGKKATLGQLTRAKVGIVTEIRAIVTEAPDSAGDANNTLDLWVNSASLDTGADVTDGNQVATSNVADLNAVGEDTSVTLDADDVADGYLYITNATGVTGGVAFTAGKLVIYIYGYAVNDDI